MGGQIDLMTSLCPSNLLEERASTSQSTEHGMGSIRPRAIYSTNEGRCTVPTTPTESPREERAGLSKSATAGLDTAATGLLEWHRMRSLAPHNEEPDACITAFACYRSMTASLQREDIRAPDVSHSPPRMPPSDRPHSLIDPQTPCHHRSNRRWIPTRSHRVTHRTRADTPRTTHARGRSLMSRRQPLLQSERLVRRGRTRTVTTRSPPATTSLDPRNIHPPMTRPV